MNKVWFDILKTRDAVINWRRMAEGWPWNRWSCLQTIFLPQLKSRWWWDFEMRPLQKHTILTSSKKENTTLQYFSVLRSKTLEKLFKCLLLKSVKEKTLNTKALLETFYGHFRASLKFSCVYRSTEKQFHFHLDCGKTRLRVYKMLSKSAILYQTLQSPS